MQHTTWTRGAAKLLPTTEYWGLARDAGGVRRARLIGGAVAFVLWLLTLQIMANFTMGDGLLPTGRDALPGLMGPAAD